MYFLDIFFVVIQFVAIFGMLIIFIAALAYGFKVKFQLKMDVQNFIDCRSSAVANLESVLVERRSQMGALDPTREYYLALNVSFDFEGEKYTCSQSPYRNEGLPNTNELPCALRNYILNGAKIMVYFNPDCPNNHRESMAIVEGFLSWDEYKASLEKG
jgi:hypothetical protein